MGDAPPGAIAAGDEELSKDFLEGHDAERQLGVRVRAAPPRSFSTTCDDLSTYFVLRGDAASLVKMTLSLPLVRCFDFLL